MFRPRKALFVLMLSTGMSQAWAADYKAGEVIVKYKSGMRSLSNMRVLYGNVGVKEIRREGLMNGFENLILDDSKSVEEAVAKLRQDPLVEYAQPNYLLYAYPINHPTHIGGSNHLNGTPCIFPGIPYPPGCDSGQADPSKRPELKVAPGEVNPPVVDPELAKAWGLEKIHAVEAWKIFRGDHNFIVADIDTGIDYNQEDLAYNVWRNTSPSDQHDVTGFDFVHNDGLPYDDQGHGTHTAGTIGSVGGNGIGISGVIPNVSIMALKFLSSDGSGTTADAIRAIDYAIGHGAKVLNNSWGGKADTDNNALGDAIDRARVKGILFVAAAGNGNGDGIGVDNDVDPSYPAAFSNDNIIAVSATDDQDNLAVFSNFGLKTTHVAAPGVHIYSTVPNNKYEELDGTSMACPHVVGAAALLWSYHPDWDYKKVKEVLMKTVDPLPSLAGKTVTGGRINVLSALNYKE